MMSGPPELPSLAHLMQSIARTISPPPLTAPLLHVVGMLQTHVPALIQALRTPRRLRRIVLTQWATLWNVRRKSWLNMRWCWDLFGLVLWKLIRVSVKTLNWLFSPTLYISVILRHAVAVYILWLLHVAWRLVLSRRYRKTLDLASKYIGNQTFHNRRLEMQQHIATATSFEQWGRFTEDLDRLEGRLEWKHDMRSTHYDYFRIRSDLIRLRVLVDEGNIAGIMRMLRGDLLRGLGGIAAPALYTVLRSGTKQLIESYTAEVVRALQVVSAAPPTPALPYASRMRFFNETRHAYGRSALLLSGGITLGMYHLGVCKALLECRLLPRVMSGSSAGSIIAAIVGVRTDAQVKLLFAKDSEGGGINLNFLPKEGITVSGTVGLYFRSGVLMDIGFLETAVRDNVGNFTFREAYEYSGRVINIVVTPHGSGVDNQPRLLNYLTAPNVLIWSAVLASCAIPGVYAPIELLSKAADGTAQPYLSQVDGRAVKWEDGSVSLDLPMQRLSELFNVNHFIVSQCNPHILPFLVSSTQLGPSQSGGDVPPLGDVSHDRPLGILSSTLGFLSTEIKTIIMHALPCVASVLPGSALLISVLQQTYEGNITILPDVTTDDYTRLWYNPSRAYFDRCVLRGQRTTWRHMAAIRSSCEVEYVLDEGVRRLRGLMMVESAARAQVLDHTSFSRVRSYAADLLNLEGYANDERRPLEDMTSCEAPQRPHSETTDRRTELASSSSVCAAGGRATDRPPASYTALAQQTFAADTGGASQQQSALHTKPAKAALPPRPVSSHTFSSNNEGVRAGLALLRSMSVPSLLELDNPVSRSTVSTHWLEQVTPPLRKTQARVMSAADLADLKKGADANSPSP